MKVLMYMANMKVRAADEGVSLRRVLDYKIPVTIVVLVS